MYWKLTLAYTQFSQNNAISFAAVVLNSSAQVKCVQLVYRAEHNLWSGGFWLYLAAWDRLRYLGICNKKKFEVKQAAAVQFLFLN